MTDVVHVRTPERYEDAMQIQLDVFCSEQGIPEDLCMEHNESAHHVIAVEDGAAVATARLLELGGRSGEIARVAVLKEQRGKGLGQQLVSELEAVARTRGLRSLVLHPHVYLEDFYARLGYERDQDSTDLVGGHELITMRKQLAGGHEAR